MGTLLDLARRVRPTPQGATAEAGLTHRAEAARVSAAELAEQRAYGASEPVPSALKAAASLRFTPLTPAERTALDCLALAWGMNVEDKATMLRQCERGATLADGSRLSPEEARVFWLAEAGRVH